MSERMLAKCVSMAPPWGKFWFIRFMSSVKQLKAMASELQSNTNKSARRHIKEAYCFSLLSVVLLID